MDLYRDLSTVRGLWQYAFSLAFSNINTNVNYDTTLTGMINNANYMIRYRVSVQSSTLRPITRMYYGLCGSFDFSVFSD